MQASENERRQDFMDMRKATWSASLQRTVERLG